MEFHSDTEFDRNDKSRKTYLVKNNVGNHDQDFDVCDFGGKLMYSKISVCGDVRGCVIAVVLIRVQTCTGKQWNEIWYIYTSSQIS